MAGMIARGFGCLAVDRYQNARLWVLGGFALVARPQICWRTYIEGFVDKKQSQLVGSVKDVCASARQDAEWKYLEGGRKMGENEKEILGFMYNNIMHFLQDNALFYRIMLFFKKKTLGQLGILLNYCPLNSSID